MTAPTFRPRLFSTLSDKKDWDPKNNGIDHINIGTTTRGLRLALHLAHTSRLSPIDHPYLGKFKTMETYWACLQYMSYPDEMRELSGPDLLAFSRSLKQKKVRRKHFRDLVMDGNFYRIQQNSILKRELVDSELPFANYYMYTPAGEKTEIPMYPNTPAWLIQDIHELREIFKRGLEFEYVPISKEHLNDLI